MTGLAAFLWAAGMTAWIVLMLVVVAVLVWHHVLTGAQRAAFRDWLSGEDVNE